MAQSDQTTPPKDPAKDLTGTWKFTCTRFPLLLKVKILVLQLVLVLVLVGLYQHLVGNPHHHCLKWRR